MRPRRPRAPMSPLTATFGIVAMLGVIVFAVVRCNADPGVLDAASAAVSDLNSQHFDGRGPTYTDVSAAIDRHLPRAYVKGTGYYDETLWVKAVGDDSYEITYKGHYPACITVPRGAGVGEEYDENISVKDGPC